MSAVLRHPVSNPYQSMHQRIQGIITSPAAQLARSACLYRSPDESEQLWDNLIDQLAEASSVRTERMDDGGVRVTWDPPSEYNSDY